MSRVLRPLGLALGLLLLQALVTAVFPDVARPDLVLVFALAMGLGAGGVGGLLLSFLLGFCVDVLTGSPPGLHAMLMGSACAATRLLDSALYLRSPLPWAVYVAGYSLVNGAFLWVVLRLLAPEGAVDWQTILRCAPLSALMTAVLAAPLLSVVRRWDAEAQLEAGWWPLSSSRGRP